MPFQILALDPTPFSRLYGLEEAALALHNVRRVIAETSPGYPCRASLTDVDTGTRLLLLHHQHADFASPYRASGPIFVREGAEAAAAVDPDAVPEQLQRRLLSLRAYDASGIMVEAEVSEGREAAPLIERYLNLAGVAQVHIHFARRGCYAARAVRA